MFNRWTGRDGWLLRELDDDAEAEELKPVVGAMVQPVRAATAGVGRLAWGAKATEAQVENALKKQPARPGSPRPEGPSQSCLSS